MPSLTRSEAVTRATRLTVDAMEVDLDLDRGTEVFGSRACIRFSCHEPGTDTFVEVRPCHPRLGDTERAGPRPGIPERRTAAPDRFLEPDNVLHVEATMAYSHDGQGLHRSTDPADGEDYVYGHLFLDAAPTVFACFDQPGLKAPYTLTVTAPEEWTVLGNGAGDPDRPRPHRPGGHSTAGDVLRDCVRRALGVRAGGARRHTAGCPCSALLGATPGEQAEHMLETTRACFDHYHRPFGIRYPFGEYHQVFVPEFNAGAMENPGCVTFRDTMASGERRPPTRCSNAATPSPTRWPTCGSGTS